MCNSGQTSLKPCSSLQCMFPLPPQSIPSEFQYVLHLIFQDLFCLFLCVQKCRIYRLKKKNKCLHLKNQLSSLELPIYWPMSLATLHTVNRCPPMARNLSDSISMSDSRPQPTDRKENRNWKEKPSGYYCSSCRTLWNTLTGNSTYFKNLYSCFYGQ